VTAGVRVVLEVVGAGGEVAHRYPLAPGEHVVGSSAGACVRIGGAGVSRRHARLEVLADGGVLLTDLGSKNGTAVEGRRVRRVALGETAGLRFGPVEAVLRPVDPGRDGIAIAPGLPGGVTPAATIPAVPADPSTRGVAPVERAVAALRDLVVSGAREAGPAAVALAGAWIDGLPLTALSIVRRSGPDTVVLAHAGSDPAALGEPALRAAPEDGGLAVHVWPSGAGTGRAARTMDRLRPCFELAAGWLATLGPRSPVDPPGRVDPEPAAPPDQPDHPDQPTSADPRCARVYREAAKGARGAIPILILGESGAGKEVMARFVHDGSPRAGGPFLAINCAALSADLLEAELFGIERGVATGVEARPGLLENASGGTLFLDEVGDMPLPLQAKVLRVLEGASFYRVGGREAIRADVRFVAATNVALERRVEEGSFRADLYHRLAAFRVVVPPLRERPEDVPLLAARFFHRALGERGVASPGITRAALGALVRHDWPGNVRELKNEIARAVLMLESGEPLDLCHLSGRLRGASTAGGERNGVAPLSLAGALVEAERRAFRTALSAAAGDAGRAMELLDLPRSTYYRRIKELGV
jgi:transcriptional regulator with AAA-type ATPase domain